MRNNKIDELLELSKLTSSGDWFYEMHFDRIEIHDEKNRLIAELPQSKQSQLNAEFICLAKKLKGEKK
jgi:hypothetical protein